MAFDNPEAEENALEIDDLDAVIYRVFPMHRFKELLTTARNVLVTPSLWDDPFENFFLQSTAVAGDGTRIGLSQLRNSWYGQCWTRNRDSDAMWRIYSPHKDGVRVCSTVRKIFMSMYDHADTFASLNYFVGAVSYHDRAWFDEFLSSRSFMDLALGGQSTEFARTLLAKRPEFVHEAEIRFLFHDSEGKNGVKGLASFPFDPNALLSEVALDPRLNSASVAPAVAELRSAGCTIPIIQSDLYQIAQRNIRLE